MMPLWAVSGQIRLDDHGGSYLSRVLPISRATALTGDNMTIRSVSKVDLMLDWQVLIVLRYGASGTNVTSTPLSHVGRIMAARFRRHPVSLNAGCLFPFSRNVRQPHYFCGRVAAPLHRLNEARAYKWVALWRITSTPRKILMFRH